MINISPIPGFSYTQIPYADFAATLPPAGCTLHDLGVCSDNSNHIYGLSVGALDGSKPIIFIEGSIHGAHEWRCAHWVRKFAELIANPGDIPQAGFIHKLKSKYSFYFVPCLNPYGYINGVYANANGVPIHVNFDYNWESYDPIAGGFASKGTTVWSEPEAIMIRDLITNHKPVLFVCCHTWGGHTGFAIRPAHARHESLLSELVMASKISTGFYSKTTDTALIVRTVEPTAYNWVCSLDATTRRNGRNTLAFALEAGSLETDLDQSMLGMTGLLMSCIYFDIWQTKGICHGLSY